MAEEPGKQEPGAQPPKIKLNGKGKPATERVAPEGQPAMPPKLKVDTAHLKKETAHIDLFQARTGPAATPSGDFIKRTTMRIELTPPAAPAAPAAETTEAAAKRTSRIDLPFAPAPAAKTPPEVPAKQTSRMVLSEADVGAAPKPPQPTETPKRATARIDLSEAKPAADSVAEKLKKMTSRIDLSEAEPAGTETVAETPKKMTARIELPPIGEKEAGTGINQIQPPPSLPGQQPPRTVRIKQPSAPTVALKRQPELAPPGDLSGSRKSETARINLPPETIVEQPVTRRKTIRIKRPEAGAETPTHGPIVISRAAAPVVGEQPVAGETSGEAEPGVAFTLMAIAATIITMVLIYVLAAQTIAPNLPFPGKV